ncbi:MAG: cation:proton antiporter [Bacteroidales bacterium]|nr:cation:proton antiporter [Bacteroidales bacterium]
MFITTELSRLALCIGHALAGFAGYWYVAAMSSTAIARNRSKRNQLGSAQGEQFFGVAFQDIAVIPILAILPLLAFLPPQSQGKKEPTLLEWMPPGHGQCPLGSIVAVVALGRFAGSPIAQARSTNPDQGIVTASALLIVDVIAFLTALVGLSPALGTFLAGVIWQTVPSDMNWNRTLSLSKLLLGLFFMAVGASINFNLIAGNPLTNIGLTLE